MNRQLEVISYTETGFRIDYAFVSPMLVSTYYDLSAYQDTNLENLSYLNHSPLNIVLK